MEGCDEDHVDWRTLETFNVMIVVMKEIKVLLLLLLILRSQVVCVILELIVWQVGITIMLTWRTLETFNVMIVVMKEVKVIV